MNLNTSIEFLKQRVDKTRSVQEQIATTWLWPLKTLNEWTAEADALDTTVEHSLAQKAVEAHTLAEAARGALDTRLASIHDQTVAGVGVMRVRAARNEELTPVVDELSGRGTSRKEIEDEGMAMLSAWKLLFDGGAFTPAPGVTYDIFRQLFYGRPADHSLTPPLTAMPSLRELKEAHSDAATKDRSETGRLHARLGILERDCQQWYEEATKVFVAGSEIGDLIRREVPTTTDYNPPAPTPQPTPTPTPTPA